MAAGVALSFPVKAGFQEEQLQHARVRVAKTEFEHERSRNAFSSAVIVRLTAPAEAKGPK